MIRGKYITLATYIRKREGYQVNYLSPHLKKLEKEEQSKCKIKRKKKILKIKSRNQWNRKQTKKNETKS